MSLLDQIKGGLAVEAPNLAVSQRRRLFGTQTQNIPATTGYLIFTVNLALTDTLAPDDAVLLEILWGDIFPTNQAGLTITDTALQLLLTAPPSLVLSLGTPTFTTLVPRSHDTMLFPAVPLLMARDIDLVSRQRNVGQSIFPSGVQPLIVQLTVGIANTNAAANNATLNFGCFYRYIEGLREG